MPLQDPPLSGPARLTRALRGFLATEVAGGLVLVAAAAVAMVWANSPWQEQYRRLWETPLEVSLGRFAIGMDLRHWVTEGLMSLFFVVVGLEVKREFLEGELRDRRRAALPIVAAIGGMVVPAGLYLALNAGGVGSRGWGIPMATDIAFALAVAAIVGRRMPSSLRLFLLTLAIVDDIGAILVIAVFYSGGLEWQWLVVASVVLGVAFTLRRRTLLPPVFVAFGVLLWLAFRNAGLHGTLAGVAMGFLVPVHPKVSREIILNRTDELLDVFSPEAARDTSRLARLAVSPLEWLVHLLHPWTSLVVVPLFALANAGIPLSAASLGDSARSGVTWGVVLGLVVGKTFGIAGAAWVASRTGLATLPDGVRWSQVVGTAALGGIGFTVSMFITSLAFTEPVLADQAKVGVVGASLVAALIGVAILRSRAEVASPS